MLLCTSKINFIIADSKFCMTIWQKYWYLEHWCLLVFGYLNKHMTVRYLRKVEDNFIAELQPNMNMKGKYRCKAKCSILARREQKMVNSWRALYGHGERSWLEYSLGIKKLHKLYQEDCQSFCYQTTQTEFHTTYICKILDNGCARGQTSFWHSVLSVALTRISHMYMIIFIFINHKYGKAVVSLKGNKSSFVSMIKRVLYSERKCSVQLDVSLIKIFDIIELYFNWKR